MSRVKPLFHGKLSITPKPVAAERLSSAAKGPHKSDAEGITIQ
jgi:hypothetical protein